MPIDEKCMRMYVGLAKVEHLRPGAERMKVDHRDYADASKVDSIAIIMVMPKPVASVVSLINDL